MTDQPDQHNLDRGADYNESSDVTPMHDRPDVHGADPDHLNDLDEQDADEGEEDYPEPEDGADQGDPTDIGGPDLDPDHVDVHDDDLTDADYTSPTETGDDA